MLESPFLDLQAGIEQDIVYPNQSLFDYLHVPNDIADAVDVSDFGICFDFAALSSSLGPSKTLIHILSDFDCAIVSNRFGIATPMDIEALHCGSI